MKSAVGFPCCPQVLSAKAQVATAVSTGAPVVLQLGFGTFLVTEPLIVNLVNATRPVTVTIWGQGAANTVLDCGGRQLAALQVFNASSTHLQDIGFQNCGENNPGAQSRHTVHSTHVSPQSEPSLRLRPVKHTPQWMRSGEGIELYRACLACVLCSDWWGRSIPTSYRQHSSAWVYIQW